MPPLDLVLVLAGLIGGFVAGLIGIGGGIVFAPVLVLYFQSAGVADELVIPLAIGTSLMCTLLTSLVSAHSHYSRNAVNLRIAIATGVASAIAVLLTTTLVTTQPWYDRQVFTIAFSVILVVVAARMLLDKTPQEPQVGPLPPRSTSAARLTRLAATGSVAGVVSSAVGVGGGVVLVPAYNRLLRLPVHVAVGTSSATIILISIFGVASYVAEGMGHAATASSIGFVDPLRALYLSIPAALTARAGVWVSHRINQRRLQQGFAVFAVVVAIRLVVGALAA
jgi:uncharacterized membrane protein YfcA